MMMQKFSTSLLLDRALDRHPLIVSPDILLTAVIDLMGQALVEGFPSRNDNDNSKALLSPPQHSSCVLVLDNSQLVGILTERDIVRLIAEHRSLVNLAVADVMSRQVVTLQTKDNPDVFSALNLMRHHQIRHLPVVNRQGQVMGLLTPKRLRRLLEPADLMKIRQVRETMNTHVIHALASDTVLQLTQMMAQHWVSCVVIVEPTADASDALCPIGIMTERDVVQFQRLGLNLEQTQAQEVMSTPLSLVSPEDSLWSVHKKMQHHKVRRLVVADHQGTLQGIVTQSHLLPVDPAELYEVLDLLQQKVSQLTAEKQNLLEHQNQVLEQLVQERTLRLQRREQILRDLAAGITTSGEDLLIALVLHLAEALQIDYAHVGSLLGDGSIRTLAVCRDGQVQPNFDYALAGTPCEGVITQKICIYQEGVQDLFPHDLVLQENQIEGYCGMPLFNAEENVVGVLVALSRQPVDDPELVQEVLAIFAAQASAELNRQQVEAEQQHFFTLSLDLLCVVNLEGYFKQVNPAFENILGYSRAELMSRPLIDF
ncbi:MAG: CBS domain-containing protein, partial [Thermosynechococcaceae cyanobacterium]